MTQKEKRRCPSDQGLRRNETRKRYVRAIACCVCCVKLLLLVSPYPWPSSRPCPRPCACPALCGPPHKQRGYACSA